MGERKFYATATGMLGLKDENGEVFLFSLVPVTPDRTTLMPMPVTMMALAEGGIKEIPREMFEIQLNEENASVLVELADAIRNGKLPEVKLVTHPPQILTASSAGPIIPQGTPQLVRAK